jgi:ribonuclease HII
MHNWNCEVDMRYKIHEIRNVLEHVKLEDLPQTLEPFRSDEREGVIKLIKQYDKKYENYHKEMQRLHSMLTYEREYSQYAFICGIDEAGRGSLAGPVVAGTVILPKEETICYLDDSKQLPPKLREVLYDEIMKRAVAVGVGVVSPKEIDEQNILLATYEAMRQAIGQLSLKPDLCLNDAVTIPGVAIRQIPIIRGDGKSLSIAAASVVAKVTRDRMMVMYDEIYPEYGFASHKGYGSYAHIRAIRQYGPSPIHRRSFLKNLMQMS